MRWSAPKVISWNSDRIGTSSWTSAARSLTGPGSRWSTAASPLVWCAPLTLPNCCPYTSALALWSPSLLCSVPLRVGSCSSLAMIDSAGAVVCCTEATFSLPLRECVHLHTISLSLFLSPRQLLVCWLCLTLWARLCPALNPLSPCRYVSVCASVLVLSHTLSLSIRVNSYSSLAVFDSAGTGVLIFPLLTCRFASVCVSMLVFSLSLFLAPRRLQFAGCV